jgi:hypothetical protein
LADRVEPMAKDAMADQQVKTANVNGFIVNALMSLSFIQLLPALRDRAVVGC